MNMIRNPSAGADSQTTPLLASFIHALMARWWIIAVTCTIGLLGAVIFLRTTDYLYTAELRVAAAPGTASRSASLGGLSGLAAIAGVGIELEATPFRLYLEDLSSLDAAKALASDDAVMQQIFADEWKDGGWHGDPALSDRLAAMLLSRTGIDIKAYTPPDVARLQKWLQTNLKVEQDPRSPVVILRVSHPDAAFAKALLGRLHAAADSRARSRALARAQANIAHLDARITRVSELDHRQAMVATRAAESQRLMLASNPASFAANRLGPASASPVPTSPRTGLVLALAIIFGAALGVGIALIMGPPGGHPAT